jgi:hypothetical protein
MLYRLAVSCVTAGLVRLGRSDDRTQYFTQHETQKREEWRRSVAVAVCNNEHVGTQRDDGRGDEQLPKIRYKLWTEPETTGPPLVDYDWFVMFFLNGQDDVIPDSGQLRVRVHFFISGCFLFFN